MPFSERVRRDATVRRAETPPPEAQQLVLDFKRAHYAGWLDEALPALDGKSPPGERFDFSKFRRELGLDE